MADQDPISEAPSDSVSDRLESIIERFEAACQGGERPPFDDFLPTEEPYRFRTLVALAQIELERRLKAGTPVRVETYFHRYPELAQDSQTLLQFVAAELRLRRPREHDLTVDEFIRRFPEYEKEIGAIWEKAVQVTHVPSMDTPGRNAPTLPPKGKEEFKLPTIPGYEILRVLGRGGMSIVYEARQL